MKKACWLLGITFITACNSNTTQDKNADAGDKTSNHCSNLETDGFKGAVKKIVLTRQSMKLENNEWMPFDQRDYKTFTYYYNKAGQFDSIFAEIQYSWVKENVKQQNIYTYPADNISCCTSYQQGKIVGIDTTSWINAQTSRTVSYGESPTQPGKMLLKEVLTVTYQNCNRIKYEADKYNEMDGMSVKGSTETWTIDKPKYIKEDTLSRDAHSNVTKRLLQIKKDTSGVSETYTYEYY